MPSSPLIVLSVTQMLDPTTIVLTGERVGTLEVGDEVSILALGPAIPGVGVPVVLEKARIRITQVADQYAIARPEAREYEEPSLAAIASLKLGSRTTLRRLPLNVVESELVGNPATAPIQIGDPVVRPGDIRAYVSLRAAAVSSKDIKK